MSDNDWKKRVKKRDGDMCRCCGFDRNIHVHHILPKEKYRLIQYRPLNGITLCGNCHTLINGKEERTDLRGFLSNDTKIDKQLKDLYIDVRRKQRNISEEVKKYLEGDNASNTQAAKHAYEIAQRRMKQKRYKEAIADFDEAIRHKSDYFQAYYNRGNAKLKLEYYIAAIYDYDKALCINPNSVDLYQLRGWAKRCIMNYRGAIADYDMYIRLSSEPAFGHQIRGNTNYEMREYEAAIADYDKSIDHKDDEAQVYWLRGHAKLKIKQFQAAIEDFQLAIYDYKLENPTAEHYRLMADAYVENFDSMTAIDLLDDAINLKGNDPTLYTYRAKLHENCGFYRDAVADYDMAIRLNPDDAETYLARGFAKYHSGHLNSELDEASADFQTAFRLNPKLRSKDNFDESILNEFEWYQNLSDEVKP